MINHTRRLESGEHKFLYKLFQRHTILKPDGNRNGEAVKHTTHGSAFFCHVDEDLSHSTITIFPCSQEKCLPVDLRFLRETSAFSRKCSSFHNHRQLAF